MVVFLTPVISRMKYIGGGWEQHHPQGDNPHYCVLRWSTETATATLALPDSRQQQFGTLSSLINAP